MLFVSQLKVNTVLRLGSSQDKPSLVVVGGQ